MFISEERANAEVAMFRPIIAKTQTLGRVEGPYALHSVRFGFVREGSAELFGEFGRRSVRVGDAILVGPNILCGSHPDGKIIYTSVTLDFDYVIDQLFWQHSEMLSDRQEAKELASRLYPEMFQVMRLERSVFCELFPALDELTALSQAHLFRERFNRMQELWFRIADCLTPYVVSTGLTSLDQARQHVRLAIPPVRRFAPIRADVQAAAYLMRDNLAHPWTVGELANEVHLSKSHLSAVFVQTFGKSPMQFLATIRAERMAKYLRETDLPVETVIHLVGWHSRTHAARIFRQLVGMNPSEYRRLRAHLI